MFQNLKEIIIGLFVFCIILFSYLHIQFHLKTSNDLEIYEVDQASKDKIEEICDLRQPVLIEIQPGDDSEKIINTTNKDFLLKNYPVFEVKIRNKTEICSETDFCVPLPLHVADKLFKEDNSKSYFSEGNLDFLQETGAIKNMTYNDEFLRPYLVSNCFYDILFASNNLETPFRYDLNYRNYYIVTQGSIKIKLAPPKSSKYLYPIYDYENFEFKSSIDVWNPQTKYRADFDKIKCLEFNLSPGKILYIPAYWWYSFKFNENTSVSCFKYRTYMNNIAISPKILLYALQNQNVERKIAKSIEINKLKANSTSPNLTDDNNKSSTIENIEYEENIPQILVPKDDPETFIQLNALNDYTNINFNNISSNENIQNKDLVSLSL